jgi:cytochrome b561
MQLLYIFFIGLHLAGWCFYNMTETGNLMSLFSKSKANAYQYWRRQTDIMTHTHVAIPELVAILAVLITVRVGLLDVLQS